MPSVPNETLQPSSSDAPVPDEAALPNGLRVWDNRARLSLPAHLVVWLAVLVITLLTSTIFVSHHVPARWVLGGFLASHVLVFTLPLINGVIVRRGTVSLLHVLCWSPGLIACLIDSAGRSAGGAYAVWSVAVVAMISISFVFDLRDARDVIRYWLWGSVEPKTDV